MKCTFRNLFAVAVAATFVATNVSAATFPEKPIRIVVPFAPGGSVNLIARVLAQRLSENLGQPVIVDNKPGAAGTVGSDLVAKAAPDGYTLLLASSASQSIHPLLFKKLPYDANKAFAQVAVFASVPNVLVVSNKVPAKNVAELIAYSKGNKLFMGSSGNGGVNHLVGELFMSKTKTEFIHVPYKGAGPATSELIGGQIDLMFGNAPNFLAGIQSGKLRALAIASERRSPSLPDVPTMHEAGVADFVVDSWAGVLAPAGTPKAIIDKLSSEIIKVANEKSTAEALALQGIAPKPGTSANYADLVRFETKRWAEVITKANVTLD